MSVTSKIHILLLFAMITKKIGDENVAGGKNVIKFNVIRKCNFLLK